ncbi:MAG TPA: transcription antiterminator [Chloroflexi bacterium]|nr:transcription antiterminator [Chloroflexota bacterium]
MTISIDSRSQNILLALLQAEGPVPAVELATRLNLSPRMVRYRLGQVGAWLAQHGGVLHKRPGRGLWIEASTEARDRILTQLRELSGYALALSPTERQHLLILTLLLEDQPTVAKRLQRRLGVSRSTLFKDLDRASAWCAAHRLSLVRRPGFGIVVEGEEQDWREALVGFLLTNLGSQHLFFICSGGDPQEALRRLSPISVPVSTALTFLRSLQIAHARRAIALAETRLGVRFSDNTFAVLVLHVAVLITRVAQGKAVNVSPEVDRSLSGHPCFSVALEVLGEMARELGLPIPEGEATCLATKLIGAQVNHCLPETAGGRFDRMNVATLVKRLVGKQPDRVNVAALVKRLVNKAAELLDPRLGNDRQLAQELTTHLKPFLERLRFGVGVHNPLLDDLKAAYPHVFWVAERLSMLLAEEIGQPVPEEETGYIAMYLGAALERLRPAPRRRVLVVCPMGTATSQLLASRLRAEFPQLDLVEVLSLREFLAQPLIAADAIISTVASLPLQTHLPMIHVHPLLPPADVARIRKWLA